ncbi:hypothetical protein BDF21DRAFT_248768 [Thamnidium elegans]|nr:hypothetical protein BDF21DRAFT_248768 [Thamnidium elegans]
MMIGDLRTGVRSRIKGHLLYSGKWKQDIHGKYTSVCITNENNTSQTRAYCSNKLSHPIQAKKSLKENTSESEAKDLSDVLILGALL